MPRRAGHRRHRLRDHLAAPRRTAPRGPRRRPRGLDRGDGHPRDELHRRGVLRVRRPGSPPLALRLGRFGRRPRPRGRCTPLPRRPGVREVLLREGLTRTPHSAPCRCTALRTICRMHLSHIPDKAIVCWATDGVARGSFLGGTAMPAKRRFRHARLVVSGLVIATPLLIAGTAVHPAQAEVPYVAWSVYL